MFFVPWIPSRRRRGCRGPQGPAALFAGIFVTLALMGLLSARGGGVPIVALLVLGAMVVAVGLLLWIKSQRNSPPPGSSEHPPNRNVPFPPNS